MPILLKRKNGEITPFRNAEYISAFYFIPKSILDKCGEEINSIPRNPRKLLQDRRAIEIIESDLFKLVIIDAYAFMVWPFMGLGANREIYSGYEPAWRYAHAASIWIKGMEDEGVIPKSQEILKSSNVYSESCKSGSGASAWKPTAAMRQGAGYLAYLILNLFAPVVSLKTIFQTITS